MVKLPEILVFSDDPEFISFFSSDDFLEKCNLHITNKNDLGLGKIKSGKFDVALFHIKTNNPGEIQYFDKICNANPKTPKIIISPYYKDSWHKIFSNRISKFISIPYENHDICDIVLSIVNGKENKSTSHFSGVLDKNKLLMLFELSRKFNSIHDTNELFYSISTNAAKAFGAERASVFVLNREKTELISRAATGLDNKLIKVPVSKGVIGHVILTGKSYITNNPDNSPYFNSDFDKKNEFKTRNIICVPLKNIENETIGVFELINKIEGDFNKEDQFYLETMASMISITLENTLLRHFLQRRVNEYNNLRAQFEELRKNTSEEKDIPELEELFQKIGIIEHDEGMESNFEMLRRMLKGNKKANEVIDNIEATITRMSDILSSIAEIKKKV